MKKILALVLALMMVLCCVSAMAEVPAEEAKVLYFDESVLEVMPGEFVALDGIGLMFYVPEGMQMTELTEEDIAAGGLLAMNDGTTVVSIAYAPITDDAGNPLLDLETTCAYYNSLGFTASMAVLNDLGCVTFLIPETEVGGVVFTDGEGGILAFSFNPVSNVTASVMISSIMAYAE